LPYGLRFNRSKGDTNVDINNCKEKITAREKAYREAHKDVRKAQKKAYYEARKEEIKARRKATNLE
jgi:hypothetical protein